VKTLSLTVIPYDRLLPRPLVTAHGTYERRAGFLFMLRDAAGVYGLGDAAPLPGFSRDTLAAVEARSRELSERFLPRVSEAALVPDSFHQLSVRAAVWNDWVADCPSLQFAWETALADLAARRRRQPLARWLAEGAAETVTVNALLSDSDPQQLADRARTLAGQGYTTFKIKAGMGKASPDIARISIVREAVPGGQLRIDANGAWEPSQARAVLAVARKIRPEFVEQPLAVGYAETARRLTRDAGVPLALDEDADTFASARHLIESDLCDVIVLKPMVVGGIVPCMRLAALARRRHIRVVYTSAWESDVGVAATLHLAAALGPGAPAAGLSTAGMIAANLVDQPLMIAAGQLAIRRLPGLGLNLSPHVLKL
jgi:o-succinylbenzoate synthase